MNNSGSVNPDGNSLNNDSVEEGGASSPRRSPPLLLIILLVVGAVLAAYIGSNVIGVLFGIISPPSPPVPDNLTELTHVNEDYGADTWTYTSVDDGCAFIDFYQQFGICSAAPLQCGEYRESFSTGDYTAIARCTGDQDFSIFNMRWWALVSRDNADGTSRIELEREVFWLGEGGQ